MVWIKINDTRYLSSDFIRAVNMKLPEKPGKNHEYDASISFQLSEYDVEHNSLGVKVWTESFKTKMITRPWKQGDGGLRVSGPTGPGSGMDMSKETTTEPDETYQNEMKKQVSETAREILVKILNGLETAKKNGDTIFDLENLLKSYSSK